MSFSGLSMARSSRGEMTNEGSNIRARGLRRSGRPQRGRSVDRGAHRPRTRNELPGSIENLAHRGGVGRLAEPAVAELADHAPPEADRGQVARQLRDLPDARESVEEGEDRAAPDPPPAMGAQHEELSHPEGDTRA